MGRGARLTAAAAVVVVVTAGLTCVGCGASAGEPSGTGASAVTSAALVVRTDVGPLEKRLPGLGPIVAASWTADVPAGGDRVPGPTDIMIKAVLKLRPGGVARVLATAPGKPSASTPGIPTALAGSAPAGAQWVHSGPTDQDLAWADWAQLHFDPASDTVFVDSVNLGPQDGPAALVRPDGTRVTVTPKPAPG
ncbi:hypothetical protein ACWEQL_36490 [Kitasatospora sp. NPDC004240]